MYLFKLWFSLGICLGVGLLDHIVVIFLVFKGTSILFSTVAVSIYIPTNSVGGLKVLFLKRNFRLPNIIRTMEKQNKTKNP